MVLSTFQIVDWSKIRLEGGSKNGSVIRWIKLVVTVMISMVMVISTKKVRRFGVASAIKRVTEWRSTRRAQKICPKTKEIECREIVRPW